jgi:putative ABC transport system permease protein
MLKNYFKIALRNIFRHKAYSAINIIGLSIGMAASIFILLWVSNEKSYDRFHEKSSKIYRIIADAGPDFKAAVNPGPMPPFLQQNIPAIANTVRLNFETVAVLQTGDKKFEEKNGFFADSTFFEVFNFPLVKGNVNNALTRPDAILLSEALAVKYFGKEDAVGKVLRLNNKSDVYVTAVFKEVPANSHLQFDYMRPMLAITKSHQDLAQEKWDNFNFYGYIQLKDNFNATPAAMAALTKQINDIYKSKVDDTNFKINFQLQPLTDIHLYSKLQIDLPGHGNGQYVNIFFGIAIFILIVACINFMNLATARSARRAKEVGLRKVVGAGRAQLILQFLGESVMIAVFSLVFALLLVWLALPGFNYLAGKELAINLFDVKLMALLLGIAILTGLIAGSYPALYLSGFKPVRVLKGSIKSLGANLVLRNSLVVTQFVLSIVLLAGTIVVYRQLNYIKTMNLGFDKSNLVYMPMRGEIWGKQEAYKTSLKSNNLTADFAVTNDVPTNLTSGTINVRWDGKDPNKQVVIPTLDVDEGFFDVFQMDILSGRGFGKTFKSDTSNFVINETMTGLMGLTPATAIGKTITLWDQPGTVVGVVKDFNFKPIQTKIEPLIMRLNTWGGIVVVRTQAGKTEATLKALAAIQASLNPAFPFSYNFLDQDLDNQYKGERRVGSLFNLFAILAIFISCLGLYGLSAYMTEQRSKEIGVRKVLGASVLNVVYLLSQKFTKLIIVAIVIAIPLSWYMIDSWLSSFAYRINIGWAVFVLASVAAIFIAWLTVSYESIKAAIANPVKSIKAE